MQERRIDTVDVRKVVKNILMPGEVARMITGCVLLHPADDGESGQ